MSMTRTIVAASVLLCAHCAHGDPRAAETTVLGPFTGHFGPLHPDNAALKPEQYYGTDLGWSYRVGDTIQFLFGDTLTLSGKPIDPRHDDAVASIDLREWRDPALIQPGRLPTLRFAQSAPDRLTVLDPGHTMEGLKTPVAGWSDGTREYALFITGKPQACRTDRECGAELSCETKLGFVGERPDSDPGLTFACARSWPGCSNGTIADTKKKFDSASGFCVDRKSSLWSDSEYGHVNSVAWRHTFGVRAAANSGRYKHTQPWLTNKFINVAARAVANFDPHNDGTKKQRVLLFGRPHFVGVNAKGATLALYFAYADMPEAPDFHWQVHYFAGLDTSGKPRYSDHERDAVAVDLDSTTQGVQPKEAHDNVQHMSVVWIDALRKWVMLYGGGVSKFPIPGIAPNCGVLEIFARNECKLIDVGNGAIRLRTANDPWGPWSPPQDVFVGGNSDARPVADQYAPGGVLHHPQCQGATCQSPSPHLPKGDYGWLYGANIIEEWTRATDTGVEIIWNASTWDPYRVILLRTRIEK